MSLINSCLRCIFMKLTVANSKSPQTNNQQPSTGDKIDNANDTFNSCGGETTLSHRSLSLIDSICTEEPELNLTVGLPQSTTVQLIQSQRTSLIKYEVLIDRNNEENAPLNKILSEILKKNR